MRLGGFSPEAVNFMAAALILSCSLEAVAVFAGFLLEKSFFSASSGRIAVDLARSTVLLGVGGLSKTDALLCSTLPEVKDWSPFSCFGV